MDKLIIEEYIENKVYFLYANESEHYLYFDGVDVKNSIILFSIMMFNNIEIDIDCDIIFWRKWIDFYTNETKEIKNIKFNGKYIPIVEDKIDDKVLWYSGGKDSVYSNFLFPNIKTLQYIVPGLPVYNLDSSIKISSNIDSELFHNLKNNKLLKVELIFPIISPYISNYLGIEKEFWENSKEVCGYDLILYKEILAEDGLFFDSLIKNIYGKDILKILKRENIEFIKCNSIKYERDNDFCYSCSKCVGMFAAGCTLDEHGFDSNIFIEKMLKRGAKNVREYTEWYCDYNNIHLNNYYDYLIRSQNDT